MAHRSRPSTSGWGHRFVLLLPFFTLSLLLLFPRCTLGAAGHYAHRRHADSPPPASIPGAPNVAESAPVCRSVAYSPFDYSAKIQGDENAIVCAVETPIGSSTLQTRQLTNDDYSCSQSKPCSNGACCSKTTGFCNYGPDACGTNGISPNDVCWSNCNAHAECGQYAATPGAECPLKVCCSRWGFCGMTSEFCAKEADPATGCQSNCDQPGSGSSGGDVQSRVIGYYEAWAHDRSCSGMDFKDIPVGGLTHLNFAFGYITPGDFNIAPMDGLDASLFSKLTDMKKRNSGLKTMIAIGGWTFTDPGLTQTVFSNMVGSAANRATFITNLLSFLRQYAFDGVDFDWEYPGAPDRGGQPNDGINFTQFLSELKSAISKQPTQYVVSFTVPTSYWYLRWFNLKAVDFVDFVNVMSYDLHGTWDSTNPIGSHVLAHTNMTEIKLALDLFWRNKVPANKLNLGLGFYGRSFQLSDPSCYKPGCNFKGGAAPGACTENSGTLSFREITQVIDQFQLTPYHDKTNAVKYIVWNQDQWVSYDDEETFKQKVDFANSLGLGGLLIWSVDQDTPDLRALKGVLAPKSVTAFASNADDASYWQDATEADCYVSDCGASCKAGFIPITHQPCGNAKPVTRHSDHPDSNLCCPLTAAPDPKTCTWRGSAPFCNGQCHDGEVAVEMNRWGSGDYCEDGNKAYCCQVSTAKENKCYWSGVGTTCKAGDALLTFSGSFLQAVDNILDLFPPTLIGSALESALAAFKIDLFNRYCCPPDEVKKWKSCAWHGQPGSCFDNHCDIGHQVQLTSSDYGQGANCWPRLERTRVFCCDPASGESPFLPVPLTNLFPHPPTGSNVDSTFDLKVDNTWGNGHPDTPDDQPNSASFGFVVLTSPETLQVSLNKRDGSHWHVFNCDDALSEQEQTIQMFCTDISENSNCHKITLGHGVPGTILEMPDGCGPSKYAVAKSMMPSHNQTLPHQLAKRDYGHIPVVYDLTFDYEWHRVPRDLGTTQMRVDFSNEVGYWDTIVSKAASKKKRKRSLGDVGGSHKRWLEEEWRDDVHFGGLSPREIQERWFGTTVIAWLASFFKPEIKREFTHNIDTTFTAKLIDETWDCTIKGVGLHASLLAEALANVKVATSFGFTLITTLSLPLDLSQSYLYFMNKGEVSAIFTLDALGKAVFSTGDIELFGLQNFPGATFSIPKLLTIGPNFRLYGAVDAEVTLAAHLESKVQIASWEVQQTYPDASSDWDPKAISAPDRSGTGSFDGIKQPTFDYSVTASGQLTAHLKPTFEFGITFDKMWGIGAAKVDIVADGWVRLMAAAGVSTTETCPFTYGIDVGADLYASAEAPNSFGWSPRSFPIASMSPKSIKPGGTCPTKRKRSLYEIPAYPEAGIEATMNRNGSDHHHLAKRGTVVGPLLTLPKGCLFCPNVPAAATTCESITGWEPSELPQPDLTSKRDLSLGIHYNYFGKRASNKWIQFCKTFAVMSLQSPPYDSSGDIVRSTPNIVTYGYTNPADCDDYGFNVVTTPSGTSTQQYATEHILEFQLVTIFFDELNKASGVTFPDLTPRPAGTIPPFVDMCKYMKPYWDMPATQWAANGLSDSPLKLLGSVFPGNGNAFSSEFMLLDGGVNNAKERMWDSDDINADATIIKYVQTDPDKAVKNVKDVLSAYKYHQFPAVRNALVAQATRVGNQMETLEAALRTTTRLDRDGVHYLPYVPFGLRSSWATWIRGRTDRARTKAETHMRDVLNRLKDGYATPLQRGSKNPQDLAFIARIDGLEAAVNSALGNPWLNPF